MKKIALLLWLILASPIWAQELPVAAPEEVGLSSEKLEQIAPAMQRYVDEHKLPGVITVVARRGRIVHFQVVGRSDIENNKPMKTDTILRFYSMSKPVTSVAAMMLLQDGKFQLDDPVSKYISEFKDLQVRERNGDGETVLRAPKREMTIRDLLRHTSGLTYRYANANVLTRDQTLKDMAGKLGKRPLVFDPGTRWNYSVSTDVLGYLVEVVSGKPLDRFFQEEIFEPLDMRDTGFHVPADKVDRFAANYGPARDGGLQLRDAAATSRYTKPTTFFSGGGGLVSTARDYTRFCQMLLNKGELNGRRLLKPETVERMTKNQLPDELVPIGLGTNRLEGTGFGLGFAVRVEAEPPGAIGQYAWGGAASTNFWIAPREDLIGIALTQHMPLANEFNATFMQLVFEAIQDPYSNE